MSEDVNKRGRGDVVVMETSAVPGKLRFPASFGAAASCRFGRLERVSLGGLQASWSADDTAIVWLSQSPSFLLSFQRPRTMLNLIYAYNHVECDAYTYLLESWPCEGADSPLFGDLGRSGIDPLSGLSLQHESQPATAWLKSLSSACLKLNVIKSKISLLAEI